MISRSAANRILGIEPVQVPQRRVIPLAPKCKGISCFNRAARRARGTSKDPGVLFKQDYVADSIRKCHKMGLN